MGVASAWRKEKGVEAGEIVGPMSREVADQISSRVIESMDDDDDLNTAAIKLIDGLRQRVTFRRPVMVKAWIPARSIGIRKTFDELQDVHVGAGARGIVKMVMVDGRALVKLNNDHEVLAFVGKDCKILRWWHKVIDWFKKDEVAEMNQSFK